MAIHSIPTSQGWTPSVDTGAHYYIPTSSGWTDGVVVPPPPSSSEILPLGSVAFGAFVARDGQQTHTQAVSAFSSLVGRTPLIDHRFHGTTNTFPYVDHPARPGQIPMVTWEPFSYTLDQLNAGAADTYLQERAIACREYSSPLLFRPMHEMNGNWYPWSGSQNGANIQATAKYVQAWIRIYNIFAAVAADNVSFVWCVNNNSVPGSGSNPWNAAQNYYPGNQYVDFIGVDGYNFGPDFVTSPTSVFNAFYSTFGSYGKKIIIGETSSADNNQGAQASMPDTNQDKPGWIEDLNIALANNYPNIVSVVWFNENKEHDWRVDSSSESLQAFRAMIATSRWTSLDVSASSASKVSTISSNFSSPSPLFSYDTGGVVTGGAARITVGNANNAVFNAMPTILQYDFTSAAFYVQITPASGGTSPVTQIVIAPNGTPGTDIALSYENGQMRAGTRTNFTLQNPAEWVFIPGNYVRVSEAGGTVTVEDSSNASSWTSRATFSSSSLVLSEATLRFTSWNSGGVSTDALFDNLNTTS